MAAHAFSDQELVQQFLNGNQSGIQTLIKRYKSKVYTYIVIGVKNQCLAEDIFQETFIKVIKSLHEGKYQDNGKFLSWVIRIAHNLMIDHYRKEDKLHIQSNGDFKHDVFNSPRYSDKNIEEEIVQNQIETDIRSLLDRLPEDQKEVILLRHYVGMSFKEIAEYTDVSINTALGRMRYALINLRKMIREKNLILSV